jgi:hypothetical protein
MFDVCETHLGLEVTMNVILRVDLFERKRDAGCVKHRRFGREGVLLDQSSHQVSTFSCFRDQVQAVAVLKRPNDLQACWVLAH